MKNIIVGTALLWLSVSSFAALVDVNFSGEMIFLDGQDQILTEFGLNGIALGDEYTARFSLDDSIGVGNSGYDPYWLDEGWAFDLPQSSSPSAPQLAVDFQSGQSTTGLDGYSFMLLGNDLVDVTMLSGEIFSGDAWWIERGGPRDNSNTNRALGFMFFDYDGDMLSGNEFFVPTSTVGWEKIEIWFGTWDLSNTTWTVSAQGSSVVPIPAAAWLLASGLLGLIGIRRFQ